MKIRISLSVLSIAFTILFVSLISSYYNLKSLKTILNQPTPMLQSSFSKQELMKAVDAFVQTPFKTYSSSKVPDIQALAIAYSPNPAYAMVLIDTSCGKKVLMVGDSFCGFTLEQIKPFDVIMSYQNTTKIVKLSKGTHENNQTPNQDHLPSLKDLLGMSNTYIINKNKLLEITSNPQKMFSDIDLVPAAKGFMFKSIKPGSLFAQMGLKPGDILLSINNESLNSPEDAFRMLGTIRNSPSFKVDILRNNQPLSLYYKVE